MFFLFCNLIALAQLLFKGFIFKSVLMNFCTYCVYQSFPKPWKMPKNYFQKSEGKIGISFCAEVTWMKRTRNFDDTSGNCAFNFYEATFTCTIREPRNNNKNPFVSSTLNQMLASHDLKSPWLSSILKFTWECK